jgi:3-phenylpropionate/trans-cinnamate dioxygenase ferredoxin reductase subunit
MKSEDRIIVIGAGHGGVQVTASLRDEGFKGAITLVSAEQHAPYQRPPLSKAFLKDLANPADLALRGAAFYQERKIDLLLGELASEVDRSKQAVKLSSGRVIEYSHLILAMGAKPRPSLFPGTELEGVSVLRNLADAIRLRHLLGEARSIVVIGAGFIGLEFAATAASKGCNVQVIEASSRAMGRAVSETVSNFYAKAHRSFGVRLHFETEAAAILGVSGRVNGVQLSSGDVLPADLVLIGIGVLADDDLAKDAGLSVRNGVVVDAGMTTSQSSISAIGDCTLHPNAYAGRHIRLESVQNALDQARVVARKLAGKPAQYDALPWFWSDQADLKLQIAGLNDGCDTFVTRGDIGQRNFSVFGFAGGRLKVVESVNRAGDHMMARQLIAKAIPLTPNEAANPNVDLRARVKS